ncbi:MAG: hypothetical protein HWN51_04650 [Desulfobacterales bacterium]|nr:hypothetical protein [Desulfobacterales bacterium]
MGGPEDYLGHIRTEHPGEWRKLETDPSYTLKTGRTELRTQYRTITRELTEAERKKIAEESFRENPNLDVVYISDYSGAVEKPYYRTEPPVAEAGILKCRYCGAPYTYRENLEVHERGCPKRGG